jgi:hypothetical protein
LATVDHVRRRILAGGSAAAFLAALPACNWGSSQGLSGRIALRKNLTTDFTPAEQRQLSDLVKGYLSEEIINGHMAQVDHIDNLFSDHRTYLYQIEKLLIRDGHLKFVPLPYWEPLNDLPDGWTRVNPPYHYLRLTPYNRFPRDARPQMKPEHRPDVISISTFPTADALADKVGKSAWSAPESFHFASHAAMGGPFISMRSAASALVFWVYHGLLIELYDKWLTSVFPGTNQRSVLGRRGDGGLELFTVSSHNQLWHTRQRLTTTHRNDLDQIMGEVDVEFPHWSHWLQLGAGKAIADVRVTTDQDGRLVLLGKAQGSGAAFNQLVLMRQGSAGWSAWTLVNAEVPEIRDFAISLNADGRLDVIVIRPAAGGSAVVSAAAETARGSSAFGAWTDITQPGAFRVLSVEGPHLAVTADPGQLVHAWKTGTGWAQEAIAGEPFNAVAMAATGNGGVDIIGLKRADGFVYRRVQTSWERVGTNGGPFRDLAVARNQDSRLEIFATDASGKVHHASHNAGGTWSNWQEIAGNGLLTGAEAPLAARDYTNTLRLFVRAANNFTYVAEQSAPNAAGWIGWTTI